MILNIRIADDTEMKTLRKQQNAAEEIVPLKFHVDRPLL